MSNHGAPALQPYMTVQEAAEYMNCSRWTVYRLIQAGALKPLKVGTRLRFRPTDLDAYIEGGAGSRP
jgi:excisionase family DNA binding protein